MFCLLAFVWLADFNPWAVAGGFATVIGAVGLAVYVARKAKRRLATLVSGLPPIGYSTAIGGVMPNSIRFHGRVIPEIVDITIPSHPSFKWQDEPGGFEMQIDVEIRNSKIVVGCTFSEPFDEKTHLKAAHVRAVDIAMAAVNLAAFGLGMGLFTVIDSYEGPDGIKKPLIYRDRNLQALAPVADPKGATYRDALDVVYQDIRMFNILKDVIRANSVPSAVPSSCGSAVEAIRALFVPKGTDRRDDWPTLRKALNVTESYLKLVTDHAVPARHGEHPYVSGETTEEISHRTWTLLNRYFEYRIRGGEGLPESEFPVLTG